MRRTEDGRHAAAGPGPLRTTGRLLLLWVCERWPPPVHAEQPVPAVWQAARAGGVGAPEWSGTTPATLCCLVLADCRTVFATRTTRTTGATVALRADHAPRVDHATVHAPRGATAITIAWSGTMTGRHISAGTVLEILYRALRRRGRDLARQVRRDRAAVQPGLLRDLPQAHGTGVVERAVPPQLQSAMRVQNHRQPPFRRPNRRRQAHGQQPVTAPTLAHSHPCEAVRVDAYAGTPP